MVLTDPRAIEIISRARRPNVAKPRTTDRDFDRIFRDFFGDRNGPDSFRGETVMDLGPGQFDFARMIHERGGICENLDCDPAVLELGRYLGYTVHEMDMKVMNADPFRGRYDGLFCKFSISGFWYTDVDALHRFVRELDSMLKPDRSSHGGGGAGWGWIAPWNGRPKRGFDDALAAVLLREQKQAFASCGWDVYDLNSRQAAYYGVGGKVDNNPLFLKGIQPPKGLRRC